MSEQLQSTLRPEPFSHLMLVSMRYRNYRLLWFGSFTEHFGEFMEIAAILWLVNQLTHSPLMLTVVGACRLIAMAFMPFAGGIVADRINRVNLLLYSLVGLTLLSAILSVLALTGIIAIWHLIVINLFNGILVSFNHPARQTILPNLVRREHLLNAISLDFLSIHSAQLLSMVIVGYLIGAVGLGGICIIRVCGCLAAIGWLMMANIPAVKSASSGQALRQNIGDGFRYLRSNMIMIGLLALFLVPWISMHTSMNLVPIFATDILKTDAVFYGYLQAAPGLGAIISLLVLTFFTYYKRKSMILIASGIVLSISLIGFSASTSVALSLFMLVIFGAMMIAFGTVNSTIIQSVVPDELRGRITSWREIAFGLGPAASIIFGAIAQHTGAPLSLGILGGICLVVSLILIAFLPRIRRIE